MAQTSSAVGQGSTGQASAPGRYAIFITGHASPYTEEKYGGYGQLLETLLREPGEEWERFVVLEGKFPTAEQLAKFDGFVLTGSRHDAHAGEPWILQLIDVLKEAFAKKQRILGVCFGHQVLCRALGGTTGRSTAGWEMGLREVKVDEKLRAKPYGAGLPATVRVYESHQDQASAIPPGGELLGASERTPIEIFAVGDVALGFQGHPEFNLDVLTDLIEDRRAKGVLTDEEADAALESAYETTADTKAIQEFCIAFLKGKHVSEVQAEKPLDEELEKN
ncbi:Predicted glutamine synthetase [Klebsormidium nitens]|uniref:Predicted glutamine synthetase n=1 Tax=Klebsormidium nitens TaxID=105231 RepID=A0A1Y1IA38_KLENI|nr:Predicted glutamine synthetase [Klebsormidium nitens]|eukprot:GAQ87834.1 Predicted glutamine synthetase [Klebsormidium nitens]